MRKRVRKFMRQKAANEVTSIGDKLRLLRAIEAGMPDYDPAVDAKIRNLEDRRKSLLTYLKESADV